MYGIAALKWKKNWAFLRQKKFLPRIGILSMIFMVKIGNINILFMSIFIFQIWILAFLQSNCWIFIAL